MTTIQDGMYQFGGMPVMGGVPPFVSQNSKTFFVDPVNGADGNDGTSPKRAFASLYRAHYMMTDGNNDVCYLIGNGGTTGTARLSLAVALAAQGPSETAATTGTLTWSKSACHLIGVTAPATNSRARIAPATTGTRAAVFNSGNFIVVSGNGCYFSNFSIFNGFATGGTNQIALTVTGARNRFDNITITGCGDAASAADTGSLSLQLTGAEENVFSNCVIGEDTTQRVNSATEIQFSGGCPRNRFENCVITAYAGGTSSTWVTVGASGIDRYVLFRNCMFMNPVLPATGAAASAMTVGMSVNAAAGGTVQVMNSMFYGAATLSTGALVFSNLPAAAGKGGLGVVAS